MDSSQVIKAQPRTVLNSRENKRQRGLGLVPASINIKGQDSVSLFVSVGALKSALQKFGRSAVLKLELGKDKYNVMVRDIETQPLTGNYINVLFQQVSMSEEIKVNVAISLKGTDSLGKKQLNVSQQMDSLTVAGLAADIPNSIEIDVSDLENGDNFYIKDLKLAKGITVEHDPEQLLLSVGMPRVYAEQAADEDAAEE